MEKIIQYYIIKTRYDNVSHMKNYYNLKKLDKKGLRKLISNKT